MMHLVTVLQLIVIQTGNTVKTVFGKLKMRVMAGNGLNTSLSPLTQTSCNIWLLTIDAAGDRCSDIQITQ